MNNKNTLTSNRKKPRSGELDFWKFIFSVIIVILHSEYLPSKTDQVYFNGGSIFVEFFFIVSGYLMAQTAEKHQHYQSLTEETITFLKRKINCFYPYLIFGFIVSLFAKSIHQHQGFLQIIKNACKGIGELLLLKSTGLTGSLFDSPMWYISAMILSMAILYPLVLKYGDFFKKILCPLIAFFLLGYLIRKYNHFRSPELWDGLFEKGMIRGSFIGCVLLRDWKINIQYQIYELQQNPSYISGIWQLDCHRCIQQHRFLLGYGCSFHPTACNERYHYLWKPQHFGSMVEQIKDYSVFG